MSSKIRVITIIFMGVLAILGATGAVSTASAAATISINSGAVVSNYTQVTLAITNSATNLEMRLQNEAATPSPWEPFSTSKQWTLSAGSGQKTVSVQFRDATSTISVGSKISDTIMYDPIIDTRFNPGSATYPGTANFANMLAVATPKTKANAVAVYRNLGTAHDGKTVTVGTYDKGDGTTDIKIIRYTTSGAIDTQFEYGMPGLPVTGNAVAIQDDGKIVVVGTWSTSSGFTDVFVMRLNSDGTSFDTGFGTNGQIDYIASGSDSGNAVAIQNDGKIVVAGTYSGSSAWVLRFNADGKALDPGFNAGRGISFSDGTANAVALQSDQKIIVVGTHNNGAILGGTSAWVLRINTDGTVDTTFNSGGNSQGHNFFGSYGLHSGNAVAVAPSTQKIVIVGTYDSTQAWVLQLNPDGTLDTTFNNVGNVAFDNSTGNAVALQSDGKILVAGTYDPLGDISNTSLFVLRLNTSGSEGTTLLDSTFNDGSYAYTFGISGPFKGKAVALQPDGNIIVAGTGEAHRLNAGIPVGSTSMLTFRLHDKTDLLTVTTVGSGTVAAFPGTLTGGKGNYVSGSTVQLTATPVGGATFTGWSGACSGTGACSVVINGPVNVTATFTMSYALTVSVAGVGTVTSVPSGSISCNSPSGTGCNGSYLDGTPITLTTTSPWYTLSGLWSGGTCSGSTTVDCSFIMSNNRTVTATFIPNLTARVVGYGDYPTLTEAYSVANSSGSIATIQSKNIVFPKMDFNLPVKVTLQGGKGSDLSAAAVGYTFITGPLKISKGKLSAANIKIVP